MRTQMTSRVRQLALPLPVHADLPELEPARRTIVVGLIAQMLLEAANIAAGGTNSDELE